jgi:hypothetical protein
MGPQILGSDQSAVRSQSLVSKHRATSACGSSKLLDRGVVGNSGPLAPKGLAVHTTVELYRHVLELF